MDAWLRALRDIKKEIGYVDLIDKLKVDECLLRYCEDAQIIVKNLRPIDFRNRKTERNKYTDHLLRLTQKFLRVHPEIRTWEEFKSHQETKSVWRLLNEFGVRQEIFPSKIGNDEKEERSKTNLTLSEFYEVCQIHFHFNGTFESFKRSIQRQYGSFAEYCLMKGYDINSTKWENDETAIRVAKKLGSREEVKKQSSSLYKYLTDKKLWEKIWAQEQEAA